MLCFEAFYKGTQDVQKDRSPVRDHFGDRQVQQGRKPFGARSVHGGVREYDKGLRTPLAGFFNILEMIE